MKKSKRRVLAKGDRVAVYGRPGTVWDVPCKLPRGYCAVRFDDKIFSETYRCEMVKNAAVKALRLGVVQLPLPLAMNLAVFGKAA